MKRIVFVGCVESSYQLLSNMLQKGYMVSGVVTKEQSSINSDFHSLVSLAGKYGIECYCTKNINDSETMEFIRSKNPDVIYCFGWSNLIGKELLNLPPYGIIGFHPAEIPMNRGRHPLIWALVLGLDKTASTFFVMDEGADTGDIISQKQVVIDYTDDASRLYEKILNTAKNQVIDFTDKLNADELVRNPQDPQKGNSWRKRNKTDGQIDWRMSCEAIYNLVRGLTHPYVGAHFLYEDREVKVWKCVAEKTDIYKNIEPGKILKVNSSTDYIIKAYDGTIHIVDSDSVQLIEGEYLR